MNTRNTYTHGCWERSQICLFNSQSPLLLIIGVRHERFVDEFDCKVPTENAKPPGKRQYITHIQRFILGKIENSPSLRDQPVQFSRVLFSPPSTSNAGLQLPDPRSGRQPASLHDLSSQTIAVKTMLAAREHKELLTQQRQLANSTPLTWFHDRVSFVERFDIGFDGLGCCG